jgi:hypothetical protein
MPKRVFGVCPNCGRYIAKRGGKLRVHFPSQRINRRETPDAELCLGSGKKVVSLVVAR